MAIVKRARRSLRQILRATVAGGVLMLGFFVIALFPSFWFSKFFKIISGNSVVSNGVVYADTPQNIVVTTEGSQGTEGGNGSQGGCQGDSCQGEGNGCFDAHTPIAMADGSFKEISAIAVGDKVMSYNQDGVLSPGTVSELHTHPNEAVLDLNGILVTSVHPFFTLSGAFKNVADLKEGEDVLVSADGSPVRQWSLKKVDGVRTVYNFTVDGLHTYIAGGFRVHNK